METQNWPDDQGNPGEASVQIRHRASSKSRTKQIISNHSGKRLADHLRRYPENARLVLLQQRHGSTKKGPIAQHLAIVSPTAAVGTAARTACLRAEAPAANPIRLFAATAMARQSLAMKYRGSGFRLSERPQCRRRSWPRRRRPCDTTGAGEEWPGRSAPGDALAFGGRAAFPSRTCAHPVRSPTEFHQHGLLAHHECLGGWPAAVARGGVDLEMALQERHPRASKTPRIRACCPGT